MRWKKIDSGLKILQGPMTVKLNNLSAMECNMIRAFFQGSLDQFYKLERVSGRLNLAHTCLLSYRRAARSVCNEKDAADGIRPKPSACCGNWPCRHTHTILGAQDI